MFVLDRDDDAPALPARSFARSKSVRVVRAPKCYRTAWISDVHLGTRTANAEALLSFLRENDF